MAAPRPPAWAYASLAASMVLVGSYVGLSKLLVAVFPVLLLAWLLTFTLSLDDVVLSAFLSGPGATTMPLVIFSRARLGLNPSVNVVATLTVALVSIGVVGASLLIARRERLRAADMAAAARAA